MAGILQYCFLILIFGIPTHTCAAVVQNAKCVREEPCFDLHLLANMAERVSKDVVSILVLLSALCYANNRMRLLQN